MGTAQQDDTPPAITVGIPVRNGGDTLKRLLAQVQSQQIDQSYEVIALDSGSTDGSLQALEEHSVRIIQVDPATFDWGQLREQLFVESRGAIVVNISQDAIPADAHWLQNITAPFQDPDIAVVCGASIPDPDRDFPQFQWEKNGYYYFTREIKKFVARYGKGLSFANTAVRRSVWETLHIEPQATGEDFQFQQKLHAGGHTIHFSEDAAALHHHNYSLKGVYRRCRNEGLALREMGCPYNEVECLLDLLRLDKNIQWLRELKRGSLNSTAAFLYPWLRPIAVYHGSRFARKMVWY